MITKKNVVLLVSILFSSIAYVVFGSKSLDPCVVYCNQSLGEWWNLFLFFPFLLFFSILTYKLPETISRAWIKYALFATPIVLAISLYINLELHHDPKGAWQGIFDSTALWILYILFSLGSLISMTIGWRKNKR